MHQRVVQAWTPECHGELHSWFLVVTVMLEIEYNELATLQDPFPDVQSLPSVPIGLHLAVVPLGLDCSPPAL